MFQTDREIFVTILLGALLFIILSSVIIWVIFNYKRRQQKHFLEISGMSEEFKKQLMQSQIEVQEATFSALSKELHDNVGQLLSSARMLLGVTERELPDAPNTLIVANETIGKAMQELRSFSKMLDKEWIEQFDFIENITSEVNRINSAGNLKATFSHDGPFCLKAEEQTILFRIVQEAVQNAVKHSCAKNISISIRQENEVLEVMIRDDGKGFEECNNDKNGIGIRNIKHRARLLGGEANWQSSAETGTTITIQLPAKLIK
jgi:signal transduction histidine kinase